MKIEDILRTKGHDVVTIEASATVLDAVEVLVRHNIGSVVVADGARPRGIFTERDILRLTAARSGDLGQLRVSEVMTTELVTAGPRDDLVEIMHVMTERKVRHLPVLDDGLLTGIVSIGDLVNACRLEAEQENTHLRRYIHGAT